MRSADVLGIPIDVGDVATATDAVEALIARDGAAYVCFTNVHLVETAQRDPGVRRVLRDADLAFADGAPVAWAAKAPGRVTGSDVFEALNARAPERGYRVFLLGGTPDVLERLESALAASVPGIVIAGAHSPPFADASALDPASLARRVEEARADVVWVGLGAPKQELVMNGMREHLGHGVLLGVGAVFEFAAGARKRAPGWAQRAGLEWAYRLVLEPRRLWRRYLVGNTRFVALLAHARLRG
jgi:N-acetylglucosaminyldiphosphoundecaprenol N-acetyl-beta-D-mannosaminyltransferase